MGTSSADSIQAGKHTGRIEWIDDVKGIAIALVVYGHVMQGAAAEGTISQGGFEDFSNTFIYSFHMAAFFFVSGLVSANALKRNWAEFVRHRAETIAWPYFVWAFLGFAIYQLFAPFYHHAYSSSWHSLLICIWDPGVFWFLHTLFCVQMIVVATIWMGIEAVTVLAVIAFFLLGGEEGVLGRVLFFLPFFVAGVMSWPVAGRLEKLKGQSGWLLAALIFIFQAGIIWWFPHFGKIGALILGFTGTFGLISLSLGASHTWLSRAFARAGAASLGIFLMHSYFQGITRIVTDHFLRANGGLAVVVQIVVAIVAPLFLYEFLMKSWFRYLFSLRAEKKTPVS